MKTLYHWYLRPTQEEFKEIFKQGILTVDANVLLDLYRYNEATREDLIRSLEFFQSRVWLSRQASEEFVRNRCKVIVSVSKSFKDAFKEFDKLRSSLTSAVSALKGNRIVSQDTVTQLQTDVEKLFIATQAKIQKSESDYPDYLANDTILERVLNLFDGSVGDGFSQDDIEKNKIEAQRRIDNKIPPGYMDEATKDGDEKYGDYFLWKQILNHAATLAVPMILVTSETKEDWWENHSGKTVGPRLELLEEAANLSSQKIYIYKTDRFVSLVAEHSGKTVNEKTVQDIIAVGENRQGNAVHLLEQKTLQANYYVNQGTLRVRLLRPTYSFTCSGHLQPNMAEPPNVRIDLLEMPDNMPPFRLGAGTGTQFDFNAHIKSTEYGEQLPVGDYLIKYDASCPQEDTPIAACRTAESS